MSDFDQAARYGTRRIDAAGCLGWQTAEARVGERQGILGPGWVFNGWVDSQAVPYPGERDRRCDTVARYVRRESDAPPLALVVEFLSAPRAVLSRQAQYQLAVHEGVPYQVDPVVRYDVTGLIVCLTGVMPTGTWGMAPKDTAGLSLSLTVGVLNLEQVDAAGLLARVAARQVARCALAWVPLMAGADQSKVAQEWRRLAEAEPDLRIRADLGALALVFATLPKRRPLWDQQLEGWNVERSPYTLAWEAKGAERGAVEARREDILELLRLQLEAGVPPDVENAVQQQWDTAVLKQWVLRAARVSTPDEARIALGLPSPPS